MQVLAPAGGMEALLAAVRCGADAVYLGAEDLNARKNAANFDDTALCDAVLFCRARGVKTYLTLNTLVRDDELPRALRLAALACEIGMDAIIVQDIGLARLLREAAPAMPLHASTQMSVHTAAGLRLLSEMGFTRAVLARELSKDEIADLARTSPIELEVFVHGALCVSVSGQCYASAMLGGRSGNRGLCAGVCRLPFAARDGASHALSLKDLSLVGALRDLEGLGVTSAKIEGRMKRPEYVAAAVSACRAALDTGAVPEDLLSDLQSVFSREGFTSGYYQDARGRDMLGTRQKEDVTAAGSVLGRLAGLYRAERPAVSAAMTLTVRRGAPVSLAISDGEGHTADMIGPRPEEASARPIDADRCRVQLAKTGGTPFSADSIQIDLDEGLSLPMAALNALRREGLDRLLSLRGAASLIPFTMPMLPPPRAPGERSSAPRIWARFASVSQIPPDTSGLSMMILPLDTPLPALRALAQRGIPVCVEVPRALFGIEEQAANHIRAALSAGVRDIFASTLDGAALARMCIGETAPPEHLPTEEKIPPREGSRENSALRAQQEEVPIAPQARIAPPQAVHGGAALNILNSASLLAAESLGLRSATLSFELSARQMNAMGASLPRGAVIYGHLPLMLTRTCPLGGRCKGCTGVGFLTDRKRIRWPVCCAGAATEVLNPHPLYLADRPERFSFADHLLLWMTIESREETARVLTACQTGAPPPDGVTRGLCERGVL